MIFEDIYEIKTDILFFLTSFLMCLPRILLYREGTMGLVLVLVVISIIVCFIIIYLIIIYSIICDYVIIS
jgi:hypothetical protein